MFIYILIQNRFARDTSNTMAMNTLSFVNTKFEASSLLFYESEMLHFMFRRFLYVLISKILACIGKGCVPYPWQCFHIDATTTYVTLLQTDGVKIDISIFFI